MKKLFVLLLLVAQGIVLSSAGAAPFKEAMKAYVGGDCKKAFRIWYMLEHDGNSTGKDGLGLIYLEGCESDADVNALKDIERGIETLSRSDNPDTTYVLARFYEFTQGAYRSEQLALKYYKKAHSLGVDKAASGAYRIVRNRGRESSGYAEWQEKAIRAGDSSAKCDSAFDKVKEGYEAAANDLLRQHLETCPSDRINDAYLVIARSLRKAGRYEEALEILEKTSTTGGLEDQILIDMAVEKGLSLEFSSRKQITLAEKVSSNNVDDIKSRCEAATKYYDEAVAIYEDAIDKAAIGLDTDQLESRLIEADKDRARDKNWCQEKVDSLVFTIEKVRKWHESEKYDEAFETCTNFLVTRQHEAECKYFLGLMLSFGQGVIADRARGLHYLEDSKELEFLPAWFGLVEYYITEPQYRGLDEAEKLVKEAMRKSDQDATSRGRTWYLRGRIEEARQEDPFLRGPKKYINARNHYRKSAEFSYWPAHLALGELYHDWKIGYGNRYTRALEHFTIAAEKGLALAQYRLCEYYSEGKGTSKNASKARIWCEKAIESGLNEAARFLN